MTFTFWGTALSGGSGEVICAKRAPRQMMFQGEIMPLCFTDMKGGYRSFPWSWGLPGLPAACNVLLIFHLHVCPIVMQRQLSHPEPENVPDEECTKGSFSIHLHPKSRSTSGWCYWISCWNPVLNHLETKKPRFSPNKINGKSLQMIKGKTATLK